MREFELSRYACRHFLDESAFPSPMLMLTHSHVCEPSWTHTPAHIYMLTHLHTTTHSINILTPHIPQSQLHTHAHPHTPTHPHSHPAHTCLCSGSTALFLSSLWQLELQGPPLLLLKPQGPEGRWETFTSCDTDMVSGRSPQLFPSAHLGVQGSSQQSVHTFLSPVP